MEIKIQICFVMIEKMAFNGRKIRSVFFMFEKNEKDFLRREFHS